MSPILLKAETVLTMDDKGNVFQPGYVRISGDRIVEVGPQEDLEEDPLDEVVDLSNHLIMPGLVNAHTHTPMVLFRGLAEGHSLFTMEGWYNSIRVVEQVADAGMVPAAVAVSCAEMIRTGTTCFADQYFYTDEIVPVVRRSGMRAAVAYGIVEIGDDAARARELECAEAFLQRIGNEPLIQAWIGPHAFFVDNRPEAMQREMELADRFKTGIHFHLSTDGSEDVHCRQEYGRSAVQQLNLMGMLERRLLAAHCITVPEDDFTHLAASPFTAVICASAGMRSGAGAAPLKSLHKAGVNTALGTDNVANNNTYDLFSEMQVAAKLMSLREQEPAAVAARDFVDMATMGGARGLGLEDKIGSLEPGKQADLISLDRTTIGWSPRNAQDVYTALVYATSGLNVCNVMVAGKWLLRDRQWTTIDYPAACAALEADYARLREKLLSGK